MLIQENRLEKPNAWSHLLEKELAGVEECIKELRGE